MVKKKPLPNMEFLKGKIEAIELTYNSNKLKEIPLIILEEYVKARKEVEKNDSKN